MVKNKHYNETLCWVTNHNTLIHSEITAQQNQLKLICLPTGPKVDPFWMWYKLTVTIMTPCQQSPIISGGVIPAYFKTGSESSQQTHVYNIKHNLIQDYPYNQASPCLVTQYCIRISLLYSYIRVIYLCYNMLNLISFDHWISLHLKQ